MLRRLAQSACLILLIGCLAGCRRDDSNRPTSAGAGSAGPADQFLSLMHAGRNYVSQGDASNAVVTYRKAEALVPNDADVRLNLAICYLMDGKAVEAIRSAEEVLRIEANSAAAYFIKGSAHLRLSQAEEAVKAFENAKQIDPGETVIFFQLGVARMGLKQWDAAVTAFQEGLALEPNRLHTSAHYLLAQALLRAGRTEEAQRQLEKHQLNADGGAPPASASTFERGKYTQPRVPFRLDQPATEGIRVRFVDATEATLGRGAADYSGPIGLVSPGRNRWQSLFVVQRGQGFRLLRNTNGSFQPDKVSMPFSGQGVFQKMLVGDLQNDRLEDIVVLGEGGTQIFTLSTNGLLTDVTSLSRLGGLSARDGALMDLDFTGKLDLVAVTAASNDLRIYRQFGPLRFSDITSTSGVPSSVEAPRMISMEDWNRDDNLDLIVGRDGQAPLLLQKQRGGRLVPREMTNWVAGAVFCVGDFDNDLRSDVAVAGREKITLCSNSGEQREILAPGLGEVRSLVAVDYDNDGWLDLWTVGDRLRAWRNLGLSGFREQTAQLGLDAFSAGPVSEVHFSDFDGDCDSDVIVALAQGGLRFLRNEGGSDHSQVKVQLIGNRSNASGLGCKVEIETGGLRLIRMVHQLPVEIGVGKYQKLDSLLVHWFNWAQGSAELAFSCKEPVVALELTIQEGSCPYVYAWDGERFRFVTDILGASPLGLPVAEGRYIEADPEEIVWIGNEHSFRPRGGRYSLQITEELREVLYLDEAKLVVVDHEAGTEVHSTDKLLPSKPFPQGNLLTLHQQRPLLRAETLDGRDVTDLLREVDQRRVSPAELRVPQLRGLAQPHSLILDFGTLDVHKPLVLVLNGWLRFGGGMANIAASHDPSLPYPFPRLEAEVAEGRWKPIEVTVGAPAGKTKTILVDLEGKLEAGTRRLRLTEAFEIHWDRAALFQKQLEPLTTVSRLSPDRADLHFRGFSAIQSLPPDWPLSPDYAVVSAKPYWSLTPGGWCTRYGDVSELLASRDEGLVLLNGGDELSLDFPASGLPSKAAGRIREFFLYVDGWDKDSDFHVATGTQVEPLPFHGMNDQLYGSEARPAFPSDVLHRKYNTRWVEGRVLRQTAQR